MVSTLEVALMAACAIFGVCGAVWQKFVTKKISKPTKVCGSRVCITGGSEGIGFAIAMECARRKAKSVALLGRTPAKLESAAKRLREIGETAITTIQTDVTDAAQVEKAFEQIRALHGGVDILFACAGMAICDTFEQLSADDIKCVLDANLYGAMICAKQVIADMRQKQRGTICLMGSQASQLGLFGYTAYCASKFGIVGFSQALAMEMLPHGVLVAVAYPADVDTPGYALENERKPKATKEISNTSGLWDASQIANITINKLEYGDTRITFGISGIALDIGTSGFNPVTSIIRTVAEVCLASLMRLVAIMLLMDWRKIVETEATRPLNEDKHADDE